MQFDAASRINKVLNKYTEEAAPRKSLDSYKEDDFSAIHEEIEKDKMLQYKLAFIEMENPDILNENSDMGKKISDITNQIAALKNSDHQAKIFMKLGETLADPGFSATELQGSLISYDDGVRDFDGKAPIEFQYTLTFPNLNKAGTANTEIIILNSSSEVVHRTKGARDEGEHTFEWDGKDKDGKVLPAGTYSIKVNSKGSRMVDGKSAAFAVTAKTVKTGKVSHVNVEGGKATSIVLEDGTTIKKSSVKEIFSKDKEVKDDFTADISMMGTMATVDMSKIQVKNGKTEIKYLNPDEAVNKDIKIEIYGDGNKKLRSIDWSGKVGGKERQLNSGYGEIVLSKELDGLDDGNYVAKISYLSADDTRKFLDPIKEIGVVGISKKDNMIFDRDGVGFAGHSIDSIALPNVQTTEQAYNSAYVGKEVEYINDTRTFKDGKKIEFSVEADRPEYRGSLYESKVRIFDEDNNLVNILSVPFEAFDMLTEEGQDDINMYLQGEYGDFYLNLDTDQKRAANLYIVESINDDPDMLQTKFHKSFLEDKEYTFNFAWDGAYDHKFARNDLGDKATNGKNYRFEIQHFYHEASQDRILGAEENTVLTSRAVVEHVNSAGYGQYKLELSNGVEIETDKVVQVFEPEESAAAQ